MPTYLSEEALKKMKRELATRLKKTRREIAAKINRAKEMGDLSENFEYQTAKEEQALNEARIHELELKIKDAVIVEEKKGAERICLGTTFIVEKDGEVKTYSLVGSSEADPIVGKISNESPIGQAFLGARSGEIVEFEAPNGTAIYKILKII